LPFPPSSNDTHEGIRVEGIRVEPSASPFPPNSNETHEGIRIETIRIDRITC